ncbi:MAG TPA: hypothetical protein VGD69_17675 [Herpetosiphonaceae bacterium]
MSRNDKNENRSSILDAVSDWIKLLALVVLVAEGILIVAMTQTPDTNEYKVFYPVMIVLLLVIIVIGIFFDRFTQRPSIKRTSKEVTNFENIISNFGSINDKEISDALRNLGQGITKALSIDHPIFRKAILGKVYNFSADVNNWENGQLYFGPLDSQEYLLDLYRDAKDTVFSTSVKDFFEHWDEVFGDRILEANKESNAKVIRVFIYNERNEVTNDDFEQMQKQVDNGIDLRIYFDKEDRFFSFPPNVSRDFTIIDNGKAIGVTESFGRHNNSARWYFNNTKIANQFQQIKESLIRGSESFKKFQDWWDAHPHSDA